MNLVLRIKRQLKEFKRIINISRKPSKEEYMNIVKICSLGVLLIGGIGFIIQIIYQLFGGV